MRVPIPRLSAEGVAQAARLPDALARFPIPRVVSSPQRRAIETAQPVADALGVPVDVDERFAEYDRDLPHYIRSSRSPPSTRPSCRGCPRPATERRRRGRVPGSGQRGVRDFAPVAITRTPWRCSATGVINVLLHQILGTEKILSSTSTTRAMTRLLSSRTGTSRGRASTPPNTYGTCSREISGGRQVR